MTAEKPRFDIHTTERRKGESPKGDDPPRRRAEDIEELDKRAHQSFARVDAALDRLDQLLDKVG